VSGDLAYTVAIERSEVRVAGQDKPAPMALRVTHIFRKEDGAWKLVHRHADPLMNKTAPGAVLEK
jgi:ketosteroid isomerase-like protein